MPDDIKDSPAGLLRCLSLLAEEASTLQLTRTFEALTLAMDTCRIEAASHGRPVGTRLH